METIIIRDRNNTVVGKTISDNNTIRLFDKVGNFAGKYEKHTNRTFKKDGNFHGYGNILIGLLKL